MEMPQSLFMSASESCPNSFPCFIDFEASGLGNATYPIEVAWSLPDGTVREFLIRRKTEWTYWQPEAEAVHGISREELQAKGRPADEICELLVRDLDGKEVYADGGLCDELWLKQLLAAGKCETPINLRGCIPEFFFPDMSMAKREEIQEQAWRAAGQRHRAGNDVRWFIEFLRLGRLAHFTDNVPNSVAASKDEDVEEFLRRLRPGRF